MGLILNLGMYCLIAGGIFVWIEGWNMADSIYFTMITGTTVGFGDISPQTPQGRWFAVFFLPFAVIFVSTQLSSLANILLGKTEDTKVKVQKMEAPFHVSQGSLLPNPGPLAPQKGKYVYTCSNNRSKHET